MNLGLLVVLRWGAHITLVSPYLERRGPVISIAASYFGSVGFKSRSQDLLMGFHSHLNPSRQKVGIE